MSYKISVKHFKPVQPISFTYHNSDHSTSPSKHTQRRIAHSLEHQEAIRRYIAKLIKKKKEKNRNQSNQQSVKNISLDQTMMMNSTMKEPNVLGRKPMESTNYKMLGNKTPFNGVSTLKLKQVLSETQNITKHDQKYSIYSPKLVNIDQVKYKKHTASSTAFSTPSNASTQRKYKVPELRNMQITQGKLFSNINGSFITPSLMTTERDQLWGNMLKKIKAKIQKAKNRSKCWQLKINRVEYESIKGLKKQRIDAKTYSKTAKKLHGCTLQKLVPVKPVISQLNPCSKREQFDPWSTSEIGLNDEVIQ